MQLHKLAVMLLIAFAAPIAGSALIPRASAAISFPPTTGLTNEAVLQIQFPGLQITQNQSIQNSLQGQVKYYSNASYGKLSINYRFYGPYPLSHSETYYGADLGGQIDYNKVQFIDDSLRAADNAGLPFANYQHITIVHAGTGQESSHNTDDLYSSWISFSPAYVTNNGIQINRVIVLSESSPVGTFTHEFGHDNGLPDLYDPKTGSTDDYVGPWSLMASGNWLGSPPGSSPASFDSWSKIQLNWIAPLTIANATANVTIGPLELPNQAVYAVKIPLTSTSYYLLEARRAVAVDNAIPSEGVLVLLVDESKTGANGYVGGVLLVQHPQTTLNSAPLSLGASFADPQNRVFVKVLSQIGLGYRVQITTHMLFVTMQGPLQVPATQTITYTVHVTDEQNNAKAGVLVTLTFDGRLLNQATTDLAGNASLRVTFNWTDIGLHSLTVQTAAISNYIDGSQRTTLQVVLPPSAYPILAAAIIIPLGLALILRRNRHNDLPPPSQWTYPSYNARTNYCQQCGQPAYPGSTHCMYCGSRLK